MEKTCDYCGRIFYNEKYLHEYQANVHLIRKKIECSKCQKSFIRLGNLKQHQKQCIGIDETFKCTRCFKTFKRKSDLTRHQQTCSVLQHPIQYASGSGRKRKTVQQINHQFEIETVNTAFKKAVVTYKIKFNDDNDDMNAAIQAMEGKLSHFRMDKQSLKFSMAIHVEFEKATDPDVITDPPVVLQSEQFEVYHDTSIKEQLEKAAKQLDKNIEVYEQCGSG